jgi:hypothetical protein
MGENPLILFAPCWWCGYDGRNYWQAGTHASDCPWANVGGAVERAELLRRKAGAALADHAPASPAPEGLTDEQQALAKKLVAALGKVPATDSVGALQAFMTVVLPEITALRADRDDLVERLAECYRMTGADPDGADDDMLAELAVDEVLDLRKRADAADEQVATLTRDLARVRQQIAELPDPLADEVMQRVYNIARDDGGFKFNRMRDVLLAALRAQPAPPPSPEAPQREKDG